MIYILISVLILLVCLLLVLVVLVQNSKGGGLASNFSGSNQVMGVRRTADFLEKSTWTLAIALLGFCILASWTIPKNNVQQESLIKDQVENSEGPAPIDPNAIPALPDNMPDNNQ